MARRSSFGSIVNKSINAMAREAAKAHRAAVREEKARMREYTRQEKLNNKINKIEEACYFDGKLQGLDIDFKSLKKEFLPSHKLLNLNYIQSFDKDILCVC